MKKIFSQTKSQDTASQRKQENGFSLIEVILAIAVLGIVGISVMPKFGEVQTSLSLDGATKQIEADLRFAQSMATTTGDTYGFEATGDTTYRIYKKVGMVKTEAVSPSDRQPMNIDLATDFTDVQFKIGVYPNYVTEFDPKGRLMSASPIEVDLTNADGTSESSILIANSGNITEQ